MAYMIRRKGVWYVCYKIDGKVRRVSARTNSKGKAKEIFLIYQRREIENIHGVVHTTPMKVKDYYPLYREICKAEHSPGWAKIKDIIFKAHLLDFFGSARMDLIKPITIDKYRVQRIKQGVQNKTVNKEVSCLVSMLRHAAEKGMFPEEKIPRVKKLKEKRGRVRFLSIDELRDFMVSLKEAPADVVAYCMLMLYGGLRKGEALHLRWVDIDFDQRKLHIWPREDWSPKSYGRTIPISTDLHTYLFERRFQVIDLPLVIGMSTNWTLERSVRKVVERAELPWEGEDKVTAHTLRHTFASHLVMGGTPLYTVGALLGHRDSKTTEIYAHLSPDHLQSAGSQIKYDL